MLNLAVNFHPYDVAFLLIDYKGGEMANLFRNLPHLLGSITNLKWVQTKSVWFNSSFYWHWESR
nr:FtsK/SpoIIIE domain-containing protein [Carnobacterium maltaromaticum]